MKKNATIMVVDDDPINLSLMEAILLPEGYDVRLCASGEAWMGYTKLDRKDKVM